MRYHPLIHVTGIALFVLYFLSLFRNVFKLLLEDISPYAFSQDELAAIDPHPKDNGTGPIPRIIHQVYLGFDNRVMPTSWKNAQQSCIDLHPDYEYMVHCLTCRVASKDVLSHLPALDERVLERAPHPRVPVVRRDVGQLSLPHPACRFDPVLHFGALRWNLHRPR